MRRAGFVVAVVCLACGIAGCGGSGSAASPADSSAPSAGSPGSASSSFAIPTVPTVLPPGSSAGAGNDNGITVDVPTTSGTYDASGAYVWPAGSPTGIPPFPGKLQPNFFSPSKSALGYYIRLFFDGVKKDAMAGFLGQLKANGFALKGVVLYSAGQSEQDAQARAAKGDIDLVVATKGSYKLTITLPGPEGSAVLDVDGLSEAEAKAMGANTFVAPTPRQQSLAPWPSDWASKLPQPDGCTVAGGAGPSSPSTMMASCRYPDTDQAKQEQIAAAYKAKLLAAGFVAQSSGGNGIPEMPGSFTMTKGTISVTVMIHAGTDSMMITATDRS